MAMMTLISSPVLGHIYIIVASLRLGQSLADSVKSDGLRRSGSLKPYATDLEKNRIHNRAAK
jgi:hypothetical protein